MTTPISIDPQQAARNAAQSLANIMADQALQIGQYQAALEAAQTRISELEAGADETPTPDTE